MVGRSRYLPSHRGDATKMCGIRVSGFPPGKGKEMSGGSVSTKGVNIQDGECLGEVVSGSGFSAGTQLRSWLPE